jgi:hypothetical protein
LTVNTLGHWTMNMLRYAIPEYAPRVVDEVDEGLKK